MDANGFVSAIKNVVCNAAEVDMLSILDDEYTGFGSAGFQKIIDFYKSLNETDRDLIRVIIQQAIGMSVFGFFCVLDGVRAIEDGSNEGHLELTYHGGGKSRLLNDNNVHFLHDVFNKS